MLESTRRNLRDNPHSQHYFSILVYLLINAIKAKTLTESHGDRNDTGVIDTFVESSSP